MAATVAMTVVVTPGPPPSLDLHGTLTPAALRAALATLPPCTPTLHRHTPHHHTLTLPPPPFPAGRLSDLLTGAPAGHPRSTAEHPPHPARRPAGPGPRTALPATPLQRHVLLDAMTHPGAGLHVEQLHWRWHGPLDARRFTAAWQTLYDGEAALRTALAAPPAPGTGPLVAVHPHAVPQLERHARGSADWHALLLSERMREFDLYRPGTALRIALLEEPDRVQRVLLTYHQALLDGWSARLLQRALYRAYLADGRPAGRGRRPDIRDHLRWTAGQDPQPARAYWSRAPIPAAAARLPLRPPARPARRGHGRTRRRLTPYEALRLRNWAADHGATESTALHAVWALQLHHAAPHPGTVAFAAAVSGRGIPLPGADRLPGPLRSAVPLHVRIDPAAPLTRLLADLTTQALNASSYEWIAPTQSTHWSRPPTPGPHPGPARGTGPAPTPGSTPGPHPGPARAQDPGADADPGHAPAPVPDADYGAAPTSGAAPDPAAGTGSAAGMRLRTAAGSAVASPQSPAAGGPAGVPAGDGPPGEPDVPESLIVFEAHAPAGPAGDPVHAELAAEGVHVGPAEAVAAHTALPFAVTAHHDAEGGLVLTAVHDRARVTDADAAETLAQTARMLRELPSAAWEPVTVGDALTLLAADGGGDSPVPRATPPAARTLRILRAAARAGAGTICLLPPPEAPPGCYDALATAYPGPQALATLRPPADARTALAALRPALARGEPLLLGGFTGAGSLACEVAERIASHGWHPPLVVIGAATPATPGGPDPVRALARTLETAAAATARP
ncbi:condensation domain-containing protein [Streptomyces sp. NPDC058611]|uniref:condensation domain-containing protein n=1 Tax=unclassified Streptomyces TaxID=2593676 RepID=UPI0036558BE0